MKMASVNSDDEESQFLDQILDLMVSLILLDLLMALLKHSILVD